VSFNEQNHTKTPHKNLRKIVAVVKSTAFKSSGLGFRRTSAQDTGTRGLYELPHPSLKFSAPLIISSDRIY